MPNITTISPQNKSSEQLYSSAKPLIRKESLTPLFITQVISPSDLKPREQSLRTTPIEITLPPPKIKDFQPNWFEIGITPRSDQSTFSFIKNEVPQQSKNLIKNDNTSPYTPINLKFEIQLNIEDEELESNNETTEEDTAEWTPNFIENYKNNYQSPYAFERDI